MYLMAEMAATVVNNAFQFQGPYSRNDDPRPRMREVLAVSF